MWRDMVWWEKTWDSLCRACSFVIRLLILLALMAGAGLGGYFYARAEIYSKMVDKTVSLTSGTGNLDKPAVLLPVRKGLK